MRIAPEGWPFIWIGVLLEGAFLMVWYAWPGMAAALPILGAVFLLWLVVFFRDPVRDGPRGDHLVIAPADGRIISVAEVEEGMYLHRRATRVSIFMNVFNVHVNRYPVSGEIDIVHYNPGEFLVASHEKASLANEQASIGLSSPKGQVLVRQIAGLVARRIVTDGSPGETVRQGDRLGMIRFGSRVDVFLDPSVRVTVALGQTVHAGQTILAEFPA